MIFRAARERDVVLLGILSWWPVLCFILGVVGRRDLFEKCELLYNVSCGLLAFFFISLEDVYQWWALEEN